ncbi:MAG: MarR family transcriptional regulator [Nitriliruptoraceae bacterium]
MTAPRTDAEASSQTIVELLQQLGTHMHAVGSRFAARESLHATDVQALSALAMAGGHLGAGELARALELSSGATTRLIDRLERVGHVARSTDPADRRRRVIAITTSAQATAGAFFGSLAQTIEEVLAPYSPHEREVLRRFLSEVVAAMEAHGRN